MFRTRRTHTRIRISFLLGVVLCVVGTTVLADGAKDAIMADNAITDQIVTFLSWIRVVLAMGAGELMTNTFVYGEFMNFDVYLRQMWNISKNFANMAIGLIFLFYIAKMVFSPTSDESTGSKLGEKIGGFLLAGVLIQASWFMMGALLDIEKVTTSAMGSLPALVIQDDNSRGNKIVTSMADSGAGGKKIKLSEDTNNFGSLKIDVTENASFSVGDTNNQLDAILPSANNIAGPLYFIGFAVFRFHEYVSISDTSLSLSNMNDLSWMATTVGMKLLIVLCFTVMMLLLFIINIIRVAYLWMVIALAPIIILYIILKDVIKMDIGGSSDGIMSKINPQTILTYIFQPTIVITYMGLMLIAVTALWSGMAGSNNHIQENGITIADGRVEHETFTLDTQGSLAGGIEGKDIFQNLFMLMIVFGLLMGLIYLSASSLKIEFIKNMTTSLGKAITNIPMIPIRVGTTAANNVLRDTVGIDLSSAAGARLDTKAANDFREMLGLETINSNTRILNRLKANTDSPTQFFATAREWARTDFADNGLSLARQEPRKRTFVEFINKQSTKRNLENIGFMRLDEIDPNRKELHIGDLEKYLKHPQNKKALYNWMTGNNTNLNQTIPIFSPYDKISNPLEYGFGKKQTATPTTE